MSDGIAGVLALVASAKYHRHATAKACEAIGPEVLGKIAEAPGFTGRIVNVQIDLEKGKVFVFLKRRHPKRPDSSRWADVSECRMLEGDDLAVAEAALTYQVEGPRWKL